MIIKKQTLLTLGIFVLAVIFISLNMGCSSEGGAVRDARVRVDTVLKGIKLVEGSDDLVEGDEQTALCQWYVGAYVINDPFAFSKASDDFDRWRRDAGIFPYIRDYTITEAKIVKGVSPVTAIVSGTINGMAFKMSVPKGDEITWLQAPGGSGEKDE